MKKSLFRYKLCRKRLDFQIKLLEAFSLIRLNKQKINELERKIYFVEHRISNLEYFMQKNEEKISKKIKRNRKIIDILLLIFNHPYTTLLLRIIIAIATFIFILEWADKRGIREDLLTIILGVSRG